MAANKKSYDELSISEKIEAKKKKIKRLFREMPPEKRQFAEGLMFTLRDIYGGTQLALEAIEPDTREGFAATCAIAAALAERGELLRRRLGYDAGTIPEKDDFLLMVRPFEIVTLKRAIMTAIELGYGREVTSPGGDEIDEGLAELNQKKTR